MVDGAAATRYTMFSDALLKNVLTWVPRKAIVLPEAKKNARLKIAAVVDERLYYGLRYECELLLLTPENWRLTLETKPDLILIQSCRRSVTGDWYLAQSVSSSGGKLLSELLACAQRLNIPTVFWNTEDHVYHAQYVNALRQCQHVFCADLLEQEILESQGIRAGLLLPAIQPKLHNPFGDYVEAKTPGIGVLIDGWADLLKKKSRAREVDSFKPYGLKIIDSHSIVFESKLSELMDLQENILGCVSYLSRVAALKSSVCLVDFDWTIKTATEKAWMAVEAAACRVPQFHVGKIGVHDVLRRNVMIQNHSISAAVEMVGRAGSDFEFRESHAQRAWRAVYSEHTYAHRLQQICSEVFSHSFEIATPRVTIVSPTNRPSLISRIVDSYRTQRYENKELVIVFNGEFYDYEKVQSELSQQSDIRVIYQPNDLFAGACLNLGAHASAGEYCFRMDDDDFYGPTYVSDMMLHLKSVDADIFGKPPSYMFFEHDNELYARPEQAHCLSKLPNNLVAEGKIRLGGNSIAGKAEVLRYSGYIDNSFASADSAFLIEAAARGHNIYSFDSTALVATRAAEPSSHTWQASKQQITRRARKLDGRLLDNILDAGRTVSDGIKKRVLYVGPGAFKDGVWQNRAKYILPDLFESLVGKADIYMLTGRVPAFAKPDFKSLCERFGIIAEEIPPRMGRDFYKLWIDAGTKYGDKIRADVVTNIFGSVQFPNVAAHVARNIGARAVIRIAGDECASRIAIGTYSLNSAEHMHDLQKEREALSLADKVIAMSAWEKTRLMEESGLGDDRFSICIRGIDLEKFNPQHVGQVKPIRKFLFVGRQSYEKGFDIVEGAADIVYAKNPGIRFIFAGDFEKGASKNKEYVGFVPTFELPALYDNVDALVLCSRTEGMPQVVVEAMTMGKPCILSRHLFEDYFSKHQVALFSTVDIDELAEAILKLADNPVLGSRLSANARKYALNKFPRAKWAEAYSVAILGE